jgi:phosphoglycolate phosphatase-like HAD superfamily hydrolase
MSGPAAHGVRRADARGLRAVMLDLDGTLVDTMDAFAELAAAVLERRHGLERAAARRRYLETSGIPFHQQLEAICRGDPRNAAAAAEFEERKRAVCAAARMTAETVAGLEALRACGYRLVVSSNTGQAFVDDFVRRERFPFDLALGFDAARRLAKGRPHVALVCRHLGVRTDELVFCGDSLQDAELAEASGVAFVGRLGTFTGSDFRGRDPEAAAVSSMLELAGLLRPRVAA